MVSVAATVGGTIARSDACAQQLSDAGADAVAVLRHDIPDDPADRVAECRAITVSNPAADRYAESRPKHAPIPVSHPESDAESDAQPVCCSFDRAVGHTNIQPDCVPYRQRSIQHAGPVDGAVTRSEQDAIVTSKCCEQPHAHIAAKQLAHSNADIRTSFGIAVIYPEQATHCFAQQRAVADAHLGADGLYGVPNTGADAATVLRHAVPVAGSDSVVWASPSFDQPADTKANFLADCDADDAPQFDPVVLAISCADDACRHAEP